MRFVRRFGLMYSPGRPFRERLLPWPVYAVLCVISIAIALWYTLPLEKGSTPVISSIFLVLAIGLGVYAGVAFRSQRKKSR